MFSEDVLGLVDEMGFEPSSELSSTGGSSFTNQSYEHLTYTLDISPLSARRDDLAMRFFHTLPDPASCLYHLIPNKGDNSQIT